MWPQSIFPNLLIIPPKKQNDLPLEKLCGPGPEHAGVTASSHDPEPDRVSLLESLSLTQAQPRQTSPITAHAGSDWPGPLRNGKALRDWGASPDEGRRGTPTAGETTGDASERQQLPELQPVTKLFSPDSPDLDAVRRQARDTRTQDVRGTSG